MAQMISFPFRKNQNGRIATVEQDSDAHHAEELAVLALSRPGERDLVPDFGIDDPAYETIHQAEVEAQIELFEVPVVITRMDVETVDDTRQNITLTFE